MIRAICIYPTTINWVFSTPTPKYLICGDTKCVIGNSAIVVIICITIVIILNSIAMAGKYRNYLRIFRQFFSCYRSTSRKHDYFGVDPRTLRSSPPSMNIPSLSGLKMALALKNSVIEILRSWRIINKFLLETTFKKFSYFN